MPNLYYQLCGLIGVIMQQIKDGGHCHGHGQLWLMQGEGDESIKLEGMNMFHIIIAYEALN